MNADTRDPVQAAGATGCCEYRPSPGAGAPPPCWVRSVSVRTRLELALATLRSYGVTTAPALAATPQEARRHIAAAGPYPGASDSYLFWTHDADRAAFAPDGSLRADLVAHHSPDATAAVDAALTMAGVAHRPGPRPHTVTIVAGG